MDMNEEQNLQIKSYKTQKNNLSLLISINCINLLDQAKHF